VREIPQKKGPEETDIQRDPADEEGDLWQIFRKRGLVPMN
jgi:hypothetical protein